jgi:hypothetical protein
VGAVLALGMAMAVHAAAPQAPLPSYAGVSNEALTELTARWDTLNIHERRALLTEVRHRMALSGAGSAPGLQIRTERRYGRIIRRPDGRLIRIETQVVRIRPAPGMTIVVDEPSESGAGFGTGFEHRSGVPANGQTLSVPVMPAASIAPEADRAGGAESGAAPAPTSSTKLQ